VADFLGGLTAREEDVILLRIRGLKFGKIAASLGISSKMRKVSDLVNREPLPVDAGRCVAGTRLTVNKYCSAGTAG
jgi:hypothetical protein